MDQRDNAVPLQTDTLSAVPGGGVRTITATVMLNGVATPVQMQVIALADGGGNIIDDFSNYNFAIQNLNELREIRKLLCQILGVPMLAAELRGINDDPQFN